MGDVKQEAWSASARPGNKQEARKGGALTGTEKQEPRSATSGVEAGTADRGAKNAATGNRIQLPADLAEAVLDWIRRDLRVSVECSCRLRPDLDATVPVPGSVDPEDAEAIEAELDMVRRFEAIVGRPVDHPEPQWLDDLIDGKWQVGPEENR